MVRIGFWPHSDPGLFSSKKKILKILMNEYLRQAFFFVFILLVPDIEVLGAENHRKNLGPDSGRTEDA